MFLMMIFILVICGIVLIWLVFSLEYFNFWGGLYGVVLVIIIDFIIGFVIVFWDLRFVIGVSVDMYIIYVSVVKEGDVLEVESRVDKVGGSILFVRIMILKVVEDGVKMIVMLG